MDVKKLCNSSQSNRTLLVRGQRCEYSWFVNALTPYKDREQIRKKMDEIMVENNNWAATGFAKLHRHPNTGWSALANNATFSVKLENITLDTRFVVLLTFRSYTKEFKRSKVAVTLRVMNRSNMTHHSDSENATSFNESETYEIDGYHQEPMR
jgi:hypothetical protein